MIETSNVIEETKWDKVIRSDSKESFVDLRKIWDYKDLILLFIKRDFIIYYKQTILGPLWYLIQPLLSTMMYMVVFGTLANIGTDSIPQPLFYLSGTMLWTYFSGTITDVSNVFSHNKDIFGKVYFPRMTVPIASMCSLLIKLGIQLVMFFGVYLFYVFNGIDVGASAKILMFPIYVIWVGILGCGLGMLVSAITTKYKDLSLALTFLVSLYMYATPVVYPLSQVPEKWRLFFCINPICAPMELFRYSFFGCSAIPKEAVIYSVVITILIFMFGMRVFTKNEKSFVDVI